MGQFKPMVKMMTTEPSVVLKLKKGGSVKKPVKMMDGGTMGALATGMPARGGMAPGASPQRPSLADRLRRRKMMGRGMPQAMPQGMPQGMPQPMPQAEAGMSPQVMKKGGETKAQHAAEMKKMMGTEAKLKKHASMPASKAHKGLKTGGVAMGQGGYKDGGIIKVAASEKGAKGYVSTKMDTAEGEHHTPKKTGDVSMGKPGGYKRGGSAYAKGGGVEGNVSTSKPGVSNTKTGEVRLGNAGGYKKGGAPKKHYATGGLVDSGKPVAYPKHQVSKPVANNMQSGTFKKGGNVKFNDGGAAGPVSNYERDMTKKNVKPVKDPEAIAAKASRDLDDALNPISMFKELGGKLMDKIRGKGSVTETKESVTVSPPEAKKRAGGAC
jgi:hypothetical protein